MLTSPLTPEQRRLVETNRKLAYAVVNDYLRHNTKLEPLRDDLYQTALERLCSAVQKFDPTKGKIGGYAWIALRREIHAEACRMVGVVSMPSVLHRQGQHLIQSVNLGINADVDVTSDRFADAFTDTSPEMLEEEARCRFAKRAMGEAFDAIFDRVRGTSSQDPARDTDVFVKVAVEGQTLRVAGEKWGLSITRVVQIVKKIQPLFQAWTAELREAA